MALYRKRPVEVEAEQFFDANNTPKGVFVGEDGKCWVETMHNGQKIYLEPGDYIIPEPDGIHYYAVNQSVFEVNYEQL